MIIKKEQEISHEHCTSCVMCSRSLLNESSCFFVNNKIFCREDYCRTQCTQSYHKCRGNQCTRCGFPIKPGEMFQTAKFSKVRIKISSIFSVFCLKFIFITIFSVSLELLLLRCLFYADQVRRSIYAHFRSCFSVCLHLFFSLLRIRTTIKDSILTCMAHTNQFWPPSPKDGGNYDYKSIRASFDPRYKQKRIRTSFKNYQINAMKRSFQMKPNPDASDLKTLGSVEKKN